MKRVPLQFDCPPVFSSAFALLLVVSAVILLTGCRNDRVAVNSKDPQSPQYAYRLDELALLRMAADDIMELERKRSYGEVYDQYASPDFQRTVSRRRFLIMANCVESFLGGLEEFDTNDVGFKRQDVKGRNLDILDRRVQRTRGTINEQMAFSWTGLDFKLNSLYWIAKDEKFLACIRASAEVEPQEEKTIEPEEEKEGEAPQASDSSAEDAQSPGDGDAGKKKPETKQEDEEPSAAPEKKLPASERTSPTPSQSPAVRTAPAQSPATSPKNGSAPASGKPSAPEKPGTKPEPASPSAPSIKKAPDTPSTGVTHPATPRSAPRPSATQPEEKPAPQHTPAAPVPSQESGASGDDAPVLRH